MTLKRGNFLKFCQDAAKIGERARAGGRCGGKGDPKVQAGPIALRQIVAISPG